MTSICWKSAVTWSLLGLMFLLFVLMWGPAPALAKSADVVLYEVTEDMYLLVRNTKGEVTGYVSDPRQATDRQAVAQLSGTAKLGTPLCPHWVKVVAPKAKHCTVNATGSDDLSLTTGKGTLKGTYTVVVQDNNVVDAPEFVILSGCFKGDADLSWAMFDHAPLGFITNGVGTIDGCIDGAECATFKFHGTFRLPFALDASGRRGRPWRNADAYYLNDNFKPFPVLNNERSIGMPTVRLEIDFD
jgi:hypothetical protein